MLAYSLFFWASVKDASSASETKPVFVQAGKCALSWQAAPNEADRETLFDQLTQPGNWAEKGGRVFPMVQQYEGEPI